MTCMCLQLSSGQDAGPACGQISQILSGFSVCKAALERTALGKIAFEIRSVNFNVLDDPWLAQFYDHPIMARSTSPFGFPPVAHVDRSAGHYQVVTMTEKHVAAG